MVVSLFSDRSPSCDFSLVARSAMEPLEIQAADAPVKATVGQPALRRNGGGVSFPLVIDWLLTS